jgi:hypothetical protein
MHNTAAILRGIASNAWEILTQLAEHGYCERTFLLDFASGHSQDRRTPGLSVGDDVYQRVLTRLDPGPTTRDSP